MTSAAIVNGDQREVPCVGCALMCDDLLVRTRGVRVEAAGGACERARSFYKTLSQERGGETASIGAATVTLDEALDQAAATLRSAHLPLVGGLDSDVAGVRAALRLAERCGAVLDFGEGDALFDNVRVMQTEGWLATTFGEIRHRADLLLILGAELLDAMPRLLERLATPPETLYGGRQRHIYLTAPPGTSLTGESNPGLEIWPEAIIWAPIPAV